MSNVYQRLCDNCGQQLGGKSGTAWVNEDNISFRGSVSFNHFHPPLRQWQYDYLTPPGNEDMHFCNVDCMAALFKRAETRIVEGLAKHNSLPNVAKMGA